MRTNLILIFFPFFLLSCKKENVTKKDHIYYVEKDFGYLTDVFVNEQRIFITGANGVILKSEDKGISWIHRPYQNIEDDPTLLKIKFLNDSIGWAMGKRLGIAVYHTTDGGRTWSSIVNNPSKGTAYDFKFIDRNKGFMLSSSTFWFNSYHFSYTPSEAELLRTDNGGKDWRKIPLTQNYLPALEFFSDSLGIILGKDNVILRTVDAGNTWVQEILPEMTAVNVITKVDNNIGYIFGRGYVFYKTADGGRTWHKEHLNVVNVPHLNRTGGSIVDASFFNSLTGICLDDPHYTGDSAVYLITRDGGRNWKEKFIKTQPPIAPYAFSVVEKLKIIDENYALGTTSDKKIFRLKY